MNATGWSRGLEVTGGGTGVVSHAGLVLLRQLCDRTGPTAGLSAALPSPPRDRRPVEEVQQSVRRGELAQAA